MDLEEQRQRFWKLQNRTTRLMDILQSHVAWNDAKELETINGILQRFSDYLLYEGEFKERVNDG